MTQSEVIQRLKAVEPILRTRGIGALYLYGSYGRDQGHPLSDIDVFVEADGDRLYRLSNYAGAYDDLKKAFPGVPIDYSTRDGLRSHVRAIVERDAMRVF